MIQRASQDSSALVIGVDADLASLARGFSRARRRRVENTLFVLASAEAPPLELVGQADELSIQFPWGSLLRGLVLPEPTMVRGLFSLVKSGDSIVLRLSLEDRDGLGRRVLSPAEGRRLAGSLAAMSDVGVDRVIGITSTMADRLGSTWAKRLGVGTARMAVQIELHSLGERQ